MTMLWCTGTLLGILQLTLQAAAGALEEPARIEKGSNGKWCIRMSRGTCWKWSVFQRKWSIREMFGSFGTVLWCFVASGVDKLWQVDTQDQGLCLRHFMAYYRRQLNQPWLPGCSGRKRRETHWIWVNLLYQCWIVLVQVVEEKHVYTLIYRQTSQTDWMNWCPGLCKTAELRLPWSPACCLSWNSVHALDTRTLISCLGLMRTNVFL